MSKSEIFPSDEVKFQFKIVVLGDSGVGKTSLIRRCVFNEFSFDQQITMGLSFHSLTLQAKSQDSQFFIGLNIWDFGGQPAFRGLLPHFMSGADAALLVFDGTQLPTLEHLRDWKQLLADNAKVIPIDLVETKHDLIEEDPTLTLDQDKIQEIAIEIGSLHYLITSAKNAFNTDHLFTQLIQSVIDRSMKMEYTYELL